MPRGSMVTTEAGTLPYYSGWEAVDAWGLNTPTFAHRPITPADVEAAAPTLIVLHPDRPEGCLAQPWWPSDYGTRSWAGMTRAMTVGAEQGHYELWLLSYGSEFYRTRKHWRAGEGDRECWFLRTDAVQYPALVAALERHHGVGPVEALALEKAHLLRKDW